MNWWDADRYAFDNDAWLPDRDEMKDIWKIIDLGDYGWAWTRDVYDSTPHSTYLVDFYGFVSSDSEDESHYCFCMR